MKQKNRERYTSYLSFIDFLLNVALIFAMLFVITFAMMNPIAKKNEVNPKADLLFTLDWPNTSKDDIDLWAKDPQGNVVFFHQKVKGFMHLDIDDMGYNYNAVTMPDGHVEYSPIRREVITVRGIIPGDYIVAIHMYNKKDPNPDEATVTITQMNPYRDVLKRKVMLDATGQEVTIAKLTVDEHGNVTDYKYVDEPITTEFFGR